MVNLRRFLLCESGATAIEYALIAGFVACILINALQKTGSNLSNKLKVIGNALT